jgi:hypothetical protein
LLILIGIAFLFLYLLKFGTSHIVDSFIEDDGIAIKLLRRFTIFYIRYSNIEQCGTYTVFYKWPKEEGVSVMFRAINVGGWPRLKCVLLKTRSGFFKYIVISARDAVTFNEAVNRRLTANKHR